MATLNFKGKVFVQNHHLLVKYHQLVPRKKKSLTDKVSLHDNLIIHGDNLIALKALLPTYAGKIKCIYIDPPYNIGSEKWVYNDSVNSPMMQEWLGKVVDKEDLTKHDKWLCMMMPRLKILRDLMNDEGIIFVSIDDNEVHRLRMLLDEVFGPDNFVGMLVWQRAKGGGIAQEVVRGHDYILVYKRNLDTDIFLTKRGDKTPYHLKRARKNPKEYITREGVLYFLNDDVVRKVFGKYERGNERRCEYEDLLIFKDKKKKEEVDTKLKSGEYVLKKNPASGKHFICRLENVEQMRQKIYTIISGFLSEVGKNDLAELDMEDLFDYPKPVGLIKLLIDSCTNKHDIIIDSFAGSGTTGQAVFALNNDDGGNRRFIMVQLPERIIEGTKAYEGGFRDVVEITEERVRRVIKGVPGAKDEDLKNGLGGSFSYFELGGPIEMESILSGGNLPTYKELARYVFYTATGEEFEAGKLNEKKNFVGESKDYLVYLFYKPDMEYLKKTALTLDRAQTLGAYKKKRRLVFAPTKYLDQRHLDTLRIDFAQLPFEIYQLVK